MSDLFLIFFSQKDQWHGLLHVAIKEFWLLRCVLLQRDNLIEPLPVFSKKRVFRFFVFGNTLRDSLSKIHTLNCPFGKSSEFKYSQFGSKCKTNWAVFMLRPRKCLKYTYCKIIIYSELFKSQNPASNRYRFDSNPNTYNFDQPSVSSPIKCASHYHQGPRVVVRIK